MGRNGENNFALEIPGFPAYLTPKLAAVYTSRGGDGIMGVGWGLPVPEIRLDLTRHRAHLTGSAQDFAEHGDGGELIRGLWVSSQTGNLVCQDGLPTGAAEGRLGRFACFPDPHAPIRYTPSGDDYATSWIAQDPYEGVTQYYGETDATRLLADNGRPVAWLLSREVNEFGQEVRYFYEELKDSDQRLLRAVLVAGDRVIRFDYDKRAFDISESYARGLLRRQEWLLKEIVLLTGCVPKQIADDADDIDVDFSGCSQAKEVEKVVLRYTDPATRFTGHYVLKSWQHMAADESLRFGAARFDYNGDGMPNRRASTPHVNVVEQADFGIPAGQTLLATSADGPVQNLVDWNRDGLLDSVSVKGDDSRMWPDPNVDEHSLRVRLRNAAGSYDPPIAYRDPLARYAVWMDGWDRVTQTTKVLRSYVDRRDTERGTIAIDGLAATLAESYPQANIGIDVGPWLRFVRMYASEKNEPVERSRFRALSMTVPCEKLESRICTRLKRTYRLAWPDAPLLGEYDTLGVKLTDLVDFNGDGYLDRAVSGLLVTWDPAAPDADENGFREPFRADPAIYLSYFDPVADDFRPFERYEIAAPTGAFADLDPAFLSALGVNVLYNSTPSSADMSANAAIRNGSTVIGATSEGFTLIDAFAPDGGSGGSGTTLDQGLAVSGVALTATSHIAKAAGASPEVLAGIGYARIAEAGVAGTVDAVRGVQAATAATEAAQQAAGWAQFSTAVVGVASTAIRVGWHASAQQRISRGGVNAAAVASNAKTGTAIISLVGATVGFVYLIGAISASATAVPPLAVLSLVLALFTMLGSAERLLSPDAQFETRDGKVQMEYKVRRGVVYRVGSLQHDAHARHDLLDWTDLDGDRRPDLVVARFRGGDMAMAMSPGDKREFVTGQYPVLTTGAWQRWQVGDGSKGAQGLRSAETLAAYAIQDVHRADMVRGTHGLVDINGDGLVDWIAAEDVVLNGQAIAGFDAYLNDGTGFHHHRRMLVPQLQLPSGALVEPVLSRSRGLAWTESVDQREGYSVGLNNLIQTLGPDLDSNGLPDLVVKDEASYPSVRAGGPCLRQSWTQISVDPMPTDPEPEPTGANDCRDGQNVWYARFDNKLTPDLEWGEGATHLSPTAYEVHAPDVPGKHYVAFNTGEGFTPFVEIEGEMPSLGGGLSVLSVVPDELDAPRRAVNGISNALMDPDAEGALRLVVMDISDAAIGELDGPHPVAARIRLGLPNADALTRITYPDGGTARFVYDVQKDVKGPQGPPMWVLRRAEFDDRIRSAFARAQNWQATLPFVEYAYGGARWRGEEYLGFGTIAETRFSGQSWSQVLQAYRQDGPDRGQVLCTETRGRVLDNFRSLRVGEPAETAICTATEDANQSIGVAEPLDDTSGPVVESCAPAAGAMLGSRLMPLLKREEYDYLTTGTLPSPEENEARELRRVATIRSVTTTAFDGARDGVAQSVEVDYSPYPYLTPILSTSRADDGLERSLSTGWTHHDKPWLFKKMGEVRHDRTGAGVLAIDYQRAGQYPYQLTATLETDGTSTRSTRYADWNTAGQPQTIVEAGIEKRFTYYGEREAGTGLLATSTVEAGPNQSGERFEKYVYDVMGRVTSHVGPMGGVSRHSYDALGQKRTEVLPGLPRRSYSYTVSDTFSVARDLASLRAAPHGSRTEHLDGESIITRTWWDGFGRAFRTGTEIEGQFTVEMDFDTDGVTDETRVFRDDLDWFNDRGATYLLTDSYLSADGAVQCASLPYLDGRSPKAFSTTLKDGLNRPAFLRDFSGFGRVVQRGTIPGLGQWSEVRDGMGHVARTEFDGFGRIVRLLAGGRRDERLQYSDWDQLTRTVDGEGYGRIWERSAWGEVVKYCLQVAADGGLPDKDLCPADWATETRVYDAHGRLTRITDPEGGVIDLEPSHCTTPATLVLPSVSEGEPTLRPRIEATFDSACRTVTITEPSGATTTIDYDDAGRPTEERIAADGVERINRFGYDPRGRPLFTEDALGNRSYVLHDFRNRPVETWDPLGNVARQVYDVHGALNRATTPSGEVLTFSHDLMNRRLTASYRVEICEPAALARGTLALADVTRTETSKYDRKGRLLAARAPDGSVTSFEWNALNQIRTINPPRLDQPARPDGQAATAAEYDRTGRLSALTDADGVRREIVRDGRGLPVIERLVSPTDSRVRETALDYDLMGRVIGITPPVDATGEACVAAPEDKEGFRQARRYAPSGDLVASDTAVDRAGVRSATSFDYGIDGMMDRISTGYGLELLFGHSPFQDLVEVNDQDGRVWTWDRDERGLTETVTAPGGLRTSYGYDARGLVTEQIDPRGTRAIFGYDRDGREVVRGTVMDPQGNRWLGKLVRYGNDGRVTDFRVSSYSGFSRPTLPDWSAEVTRRQCHDIVGRVQAAIDDEGRMERYQYDARGRLEELSHWVNGAWEAAYTFNYTPAGRLLGTSRPVIGTTRAATKYAYDGFGRLERLSQGQVKADTVFSYDGAGRMCSVSKEVDGKTVSAVSVLYDPRGRPVETRDSDGVVRTTSYAPDGTVAAVTDGTGRWAYDHAADGRLIRHVQEVDGIGRAFETTYHYDLRGRLDWMRLPAVTGASGPVVRFDREDASDLVTAIHWNDAQVYGVGRYDGHGRRIDWNLGPALGTSTYDDAGQLENVTVQSAARVLRDWRLIRDGAGFVERVEDRLDSAFSAGLELDDRGRLQRETIPALGGTRTYQWTGVDTPRDERGAGRGPFRFQYDRDGVLTGVLRGRNLDEMTYDDRGARTADALSGLSMGYDALGRLTSVKTDKTGETIEIDYAHDGRRVRTGQTVYLYGSGTTPMAEVYLDKDDRITGGRYLLHIAGALGLTIDAATDAKRYFLTDHQRSPVLEIDAQGQVLAERAFDAFGDEIARGGQAGSGFSTEIGFAGAYRLGETPFYIMGHRVYDAETASFLTPDPLGGATDAGLYAYANANPHHFSDPTGLDPTEVEMPATLVTGGPRAPAPSPLDRLGTWTYNRMNSQASAIADFMERKYSPSALNQAGSNFVTWIQSPDHFVGAGGTALYRTGQGLGFAAQGDFENSADSYVEALKSFGRAGLNWPLDNVEAVVVIGQGVAGTVKAGEDFANDFVTIGPVLFFGSDEELYRATQEMLEHNHKLASDLAQGFLLQWVGGKFSMGRGGRPGGGYPGQIAPALSETDLANIELLLSVLERAAADAGTTPEALFRTLNYNPASLTSRASFRPSDRPLWPGGPAGPGELTIGPKAFTKGEQYVYMMVSHEISHAKDFLTYIRRYGPEKARKQWTRAAQQGEPHLFQEIRGQTSAMARLARAYGGQIDPLVMKWHETFMDNAFRGMAHDEFGPAFYDLFPPAD